MPDTDPEGAYIFDVDGITIDTDNPEFLEFLLEAFEPIKRALRKHNLRELRREHLDLLDQCLEEQSVEFYRELDHPDEPSSF